MEAPVRSRKLKMKKSRLQRTVYVYSVHVPGRAPDVAWVIGYSLYTIKAYRLGEGVELHILPRCVVVETRFILTVYDICWVVGETRKHYKPFYRFLVGVTGGLGYTCTNNRARRQSGFPTFISCQRQDAGRAILQKVGTLKLVIIQN